MRPACAKRSVISIDIDGTSEDQVPEQPEGHDPSETGALAPCIHKSGKGFVAACQGQYSDALTKGHGVSLHHAESTGALGVVFMATLRILARQSRLKGATDYTRYGEGRASSKAFLTHHVANISTAIQVAVWPTPTQCARRRLRPLPTPVAEP